MTTSVDEEPRHKRDDRNCDDDDDHDSGGRGAIVRRGCTSTLFLANRRTDARLAAIRGCLAGGALVDGGGRCLGVGGISLVGGNHEDGVQGPGDKSADLDVVG